MSLTTYLKQKNAFVGIFPDQTALTATRKDKQAILEAIECDLSPENLCCDGEASPKFVRKQSRMLHKARDEAEAL